ncbi:MAG TPA: hypothetical protein VK611_21665 [Acidimicrobiales bacterium]|nr:hypothetical protein [Acidimicrobiales bacterium]
MALLPTTVSIQRLTETLRALGEAPAKGQPRRIDDLEARLVRAVQRDGTGVSVPDGYPTGTLGGGGRGGPVVAVEADENGPADVVAVTSVEGTVIARIEPDERAVRQLRDRHHELTVRAVQAVDSAVAGVQRAFGALASLDDLLKTGPPAPKTCDHCTRKRGKGWDRPIYATGTVGDRLERAKALCEACHSFVRQTAAAGSRAGYLPSDKQISDHEQRGRWRIHVT